MTEKQLKDLRERWRDLSMVCFAGCTDSRPCTACREQDRIEAQVKKAGWNLFTLKRVAT